MSNTAFFNTSIANLPFNNELWDYSCACYERPEVQNLCLQLQDDFSADVSVLLASGWAATRGIAPDWPRILPPVKRWQEEIVGPLREVRRKLSKKVAAENRIRTELMTVELSTEKTALAFLFERLTECHTPGLNHPHIDRSLLTRKNLENYLQWLTKKSLNDQQQLTRLSRQLSDWLSRQPVSLTDV